MRLLIKLIFASGLFAGLLTANAATFNGSKPLLCAIQDLTQCDDGGACQFVTPASVNVPDFLQVDAVGMLITATPETGIQRNTVIEHSEQLDGKLVLQGADDGIEGVRDGLAWSMVIDEATGRLALSASGDGFAMVAFGACTLR